MYKDLSGEKYGRLLVIERHGSSACQKATWLCQCDCGNTTIVTTGSLHNGNTSSCGCLYKEVRPYTARKHGESQTRLYSIWKAMNKRCNNNNTGRWNRYGGRGITVCKEWQDDYIPFRDWSLQNGYSDNLSIDRINNDGNYEPSNCRWATTTQQANNTSHNVWIKHDGRIQSMSQWGAELGIPISTLSCRYKKGLRGDELLKVSSYNTEGNI